MIFWDAIFTFIESFLICFVSFLIYGIKSKKKFSLAVLFCMGITLFFNYVYPSDFGVLFGVILIVPLLISKEQKNHKLSYFLTPLILYVLLTLSNVLSMAIMSVVLKVDITSINNQNLDLFLPTAILSRILFLGVSYLDLKINLKIKNQQLENKATFAIVSFLLSAVLLFLTLMSSILYQVFSIQILYEMIFFLFILCGSSVFAYFVMIKMNNENVIITKQLMNEQYQKELYAMTKRSTELIANDMHMMKYSLLKIQNGIKQNQIENTLNFVNSELDRYMDYDRIQVTNNPIFDFELTTFRSLCRRKNILLKTIISVRESSILLSNVSYVNVLIELLENIVNLSDEIKQVSFYLEEKEDCYKLRIILDHIIDYDCYFDNLSKIASYDKHIYNDFEEYTVVIMKSRLY